VASPALDLPSSFFLDFRAALATVITSVATVPHEEELEPVEAVPKRPLI
jgi:hypothetical protein